MNVSYSRRLELASIRHFATSRDPWCGHLFPCSWQQVASHEKLDCVVRYSVREPDLFNRTLEQSPGGIAP